MSTKTLSVCLVIIMCVLSVNAGVYSGPEDTTNAYDPAISKSDSSIVEWANEVVEYCPASYGVTSNYQNPETGYGSLGDLTSDQIASGAEPGYVTVTFEYGIANGDGYDFAVFENGFKYGTNGIFMELAYVEVSTDGINFARFASISTNTEAVAGSGAFSGWDTTNVYNLAGKNATGYGTTFDLEELTGCDLVTEGLLDLNNIQYVRLVDIPGTGDYVDSLGNPIYDASVTSGSGGYDFSLAYNGVAVINQVPEPCTLALLGLGGLALRNRRKA